MTKLFLIAATLLSAATSPVIAREARPAGATSDSTSTAASAPARTAPAAVRYCVEDTITGSRIRHKTCMTRQEWITTTGQDPLAKN